MPVVVFGQPQGFGLRRFFGVERAGDRLPRDIGAGPERLKPPVSSG
ncbi:hypothetical protein [Laribacter hongkongensis]|nr:hypothetical protein [Laribacter hongkongensis]